MRMAQRARNRRDEDGPEINSKDDARVREHPARACHHYTGHRRIKNVLHFRIRWHETLQEKEHLMQFCRVGTEKAEQMPEEKQSGRERKKEQIRHLGSQARRGISGGFPNQAAQNAPDESEKLHLRPEFTLPVKNIH